MQRVTKAQMRQSNLNRYNKLIIHSLSYTLIPSLGNFSLFFVFWAYFYAIYINLSALPSF